MAQLPVSTDRLVEQICECRNLIALHALVGNCRYVEDLECWSGVLQREWERRDVGS